MTDVPPEQTQNIDALVQRILAGGDNRDTDRANGMEFASAFSSNALWSPESDEWFIWDGRRWAPDIQRDRTILIGELADLLMMRATRQDEEASGVTLRRARRLETVAGHNGCLTFAGPLMRRSITKFDADPWLLNCPNGTVDLRTGELREQRQEDYITRMCPVSYDPNATDPIWNKVLWDAFAGDQDMARYLCRYAGLCLTGVTTQKIILVVNGPTNGGKSTVTEPVYRVLGDVADGGYATSWSADVIQANTNVNRPEKLNKARGARLIVVGELEKGSRMADSFVKQLSGGDVMDHRALYRDSYSHRPTAKILMHTNYIPRSTDPALHARLRLLPFNHPPPFKDPRVKEHLEESDAAQRAILAWAVRGAGGFHREGMSVMPWHDVELQRYVLASDHVQTFIHECLEDTQERAESISTERCWQLYQVWGIEHIRRPLRRMSFEAAMKERGYEKTRVPAKGGTMRWVGLREVGGGVIL